VFLLLRGRKCGDAGHGSTLRKPSLQNTPPLPTSGDGWFSGHELHYICGIDGIEIIAGQKISSQVLNTKNQTPDNRHWTLEIPNPRFSGVFQGVTIPQFFSLCFHLNKKKTGVKNGVHFIRKSGNRGRERP
jgi:hypothetical protein